MLDKNISELNLTPQSYMLLISNGIKKISSLIMYKKEDLLNLTISYKKYSKREKVEEMVNEIISKLKTHELKLNTKTNQRPLKTEVRIKDLNISNSVTRRLENHGIITLGKLSLLNEKSILNMYRIGDKSLKEITDAVNKQNISLGNNYNDMIMYGLSEEEIEYYNKQKEILDNEEIEYNKSFEEKEKERQEFKKRRNKLFNMKLTELAISYPYFKNGLTLVEPTLSDLLSFPKDTLINGDEIDEQLRSMNLGIHLDMNFLEKEKIKITEEDFKDLKINILERRIERLEREYKNNRASDMYPYDTSYKYEK